MTQERIDVAALPVARRWAADHPDTLFLPVRMAVQSGGLTLAAAFGRLFWPDLIEVDGCVIIKDHYQPASFEYWRNHFSGDTPEIEKMINRIDLEDLYMVSEDLDEATADRVLTELAWIASKTWSAALQESFPGRKFNVGLFPGDDFDYPSVWFHSVA